MKKFLLAVALMTSIVQAGESEYDLKYYNGRFGFKVSYPGGELTNEFTTGLFIPTGESANGDGQRFVQSDGQAYIMVYGSY